MKTLQTRAERTGYKETSLHSDVMEYVDCLAREYPKRVSLSMFGKSPLGKDLPLLVLSNRGIRNPQEALGTGQPIVLMMDGIHPGEVEGKEATLALMRDMLSSSDGDILDEIVLLIVPLFNPDGNDALDPKNRALHLKRLEGQIGPVVGTRTQSNGINLNRDYMRRAALEMQLLQKNVCLPWKPDLTIDNHATNGSVHRFQMTVDIPHTVDSGRREPIEFMRHRLVPDVIEAVNKRGFESGWYGNFAEDEKALDAGVEILGTEKVGEGWMTYPHHPRFGSNYRGLTNRLDLLLECYSYLPFQERVETAYAWQIETLNWTFSNREKVLECIHRSQTPPEEISVRYTLERMEKPVEILTREPRTLDGKPVALKIPHLAKFIGTQKIRRPKAYLVPESVARHLQTHGLNISEVSSKNRKVEIATVASVGSENGRKILEAGHVGEIEVEWRVEDRKIPENYFSVSANQPLGSVAVYFCEPESDDGAAENGLIEAPRLGAEHPIWREVE